MKKLVVLLSNSGTGSNLQAMIDAIDAQSLHAEIVGVISDKEDAQGLERAQKHGIQTCICQKKENLFPLLLNLQPTYICLAGWKQIITPDVLDAYRNRILNIHPGLIPDTITGAVTNPDGTKGLWNRGKFTDAAIQNVLDQQISYAGSTVHFLSQEFDFGPVLARCFEKVEKNDTVKSLYKRLKNKENMIYVEALKKLCNE